MPSRAARSGDGFRLRRIAIQTELVGRQERIQHTESELRRLERKATELTRQIDACVHALRRYSRVMCFELDAEYQEQLGDSRQEFNKLHERKEVLGQELLSHQAEVSRFLEVSKNNQDLQLAGEQALMRAAGLAKDAETIALRGFGVIDHD